MDPISSAGLAPITTPFLDLRARIRTSPLWIVAVALFLRVGWIILSHVFPHHAFDEYPFPLLATILALEAVLLTSCVLIRQSLNDRTLERRDHLELQINLLAEREATQSLRILQRIAKKLDVEDGSPDELASETSPPPTSFTSVPVGQLSLCSSSGASPARP